jgi:hypothetical protein
LTYRTVKRKRGRYGWFSCDISYCFLTFKFIFIDFYYVFIVFYCRYRLKNSITNATQSLAISDQPVVLPVIIRSDFLSKSKPSALKMRPFLESLQFNRSSGRRYAGALAVHYTRDGCESGGFGVFKTV